MNGSYNLRSFTALIYAFFKPNKRRIGTFRSIQNRLSVECNTLRLYPIALLDNDRSAASALFFADFFDQSSPVKLKL